MERSLRVLDGAVGLFCAVGGVEPQSETVWRQAEKYRVPRIAFVNKLDRAGADFFRTVSAMEDRLGTSPMILQLPLGNEEKFCGVIDLLRMQAIVYDEDNLGVGYRTTDILILTTSRARQYQARLLEDVAELDEDLMERYLAEEVITPRELAKVIRQGTINNQITRFSAVLHSGTKACSLCWMALSITYPRLSMSSPWLA